jgi:hypothetical protein
VPGLSIAALFTGGLLPAFVAALALVVPTIDPLSVITRC